MKKKIQMPDFGTEEVEVIEILVQKNESITIDQPLITVEGSKSSIEVPSPQNGVIEEIKVKIGEKINTGKTILVLKENKNNLKKNKDIKENNKKIFIPEVINKKAQIIDILVKKGDYIKKKQNILLVLINNDLKKISSSYSGIVIEIYVKIKDFISEKSLIMILNTDKKEYFEKQVFSKDISKDKKKILSFNQLNVNISKKQRNNFVHATPIIKRLAKKFDVNLNKVEGSGPHNRILKDDIYFHIQNDLKTFFSEEPGLEKKKSQLDLMQWPEINFKKFGNIKEIEFNRIQKISEKNLSRNWIMIPHVTCHEEIDITNLEDFRCQQNYKKKLNFKLTLIAFFMKIIEKSLIQFPQFNSSILINKNKIILKKYINIGFAVDTPNGLIVPVIHNVNKKNVVNLAEEISKKANDARLGKLKPIDLEGGCFTISSLGNIGTTYFTPIINAPEVAILGISKSSKKPIWDGKKFIPRLILPLSLSFDHRVINGADAAKFIKYISNIVKDIRELIM